MCYKSTKNIDCGVKKKYRFDEKRQNISFYWNKIDNTFVDLLKDLIDWSKLKRFNIIIKKGNQL